MSKNTKKRNLLKAWAVGQLQSFGDAASNFLFGLYCIILLFIVIWNNHSTEQLIIENNNLNSDIQEYAWEYTSLKAELNHKSKQSEVAKQVSDLGLKELRFPPHKIIINEQDYK